MPSRRDFVAQAGLSTAGLLLPGRGSLRTIQSLLGAPEAAAGFLDLRRPPDLILAQTPSITRTLQRAADRWSSGDGIAVSTSVNPGALHVALESPKAEINRLYLRWRGDLTNVRLITGDAWERAYGDLQWHTWTPDAAMPWYFATLTDHATHAYGVLTGANALCYWQVDHEGISLCADVRSGGSALKLGERTLDVCDVVCRAGGDHESSFAAMHAFCAQMCPNPRLPKQPVYGSNDWYWAYGNNSAQSVRTDADHILELSPGGDNRPYVVIDDGWQPGRGEDKSGAGAWDRGNEKFPDMAALAAELRAKSTLPGIWIRPLQASVTTPDAWRLSRSRTVLDPTVPEVQQKIAQDIARIHGWGFALIKHDYSTFDIMGRWGFQMGTALTRDGWTFASGPNRTTAEVIRALYATIRAAAADSLVIGCNTVNHLAAGEFEICRIGDDTSGSEWARTRKMGVNSLAFRGPQHGAFYAADADCVGVTKDIPWELNRQWLELVSQSGTTTFVSLAADALGAVQRQDLKRALAIAASPRPLGQPIDWQRRVYPEHWELAGRKQNFDWFGPDGAGLP
jgi:alpha-galactosidase